MRHQGSLLLRWQFPTWNHFTHVVGAWMSNYIHFLSLMAPTALRSVFTWSVITANMFVNISIMALSSKHLQCIYTQHFSVVPKYPQLWHRYISHRCRQQFLQAKYSTIQWWYARLEFMVKKLLNTACEILKRLLKHNKNIHEIAFTLFA